MMPIHYHKAELRGTRWGEGGTQLFFSCRGVRPGFSKYGSCELIIASEKGVLCSDYCLRKGGSRELKIYKFGVF